MSEYASSRYSIYREQCQSRRMHSVLLLRDLVHPQLSQTLLYSIDVSVSDRPYASLTQERAMP